MRDLRSFIGLGKTGTRVVLILIVIAVSVILSLSYKNGEYTGTTNGSSGEKEQDYSDLRYLLNSSSHNKQSQCPTSGTEKLSTTLVTQTTLDRLELLSQTCERWKSPIVAVVYVTQKESANNWISISKEYEEKCLHLKLLSYVALSDEERSHAYPINKMRNIGLDHVKTSHVLLIDADFIPSVDLDVGALKAINLAAKEKESSSDMSSYALVIPAYERQLKTSPCKTLDGCLEISRKDEEFMPRSIKSLKKCVNDGKCIVFHSDYFPMGHGNTQSDQWLREEDTSRIRRIPCIADEYEPYVVIPWCTTQNASHINDGKERMFPKSPYYDERFYGYGMNKIQQIKHLQARGYKFAVIPAIGFLTHHPHPVSSTKEIWKGNKGGSPNTDGMKTKMFKLFDEYKGELETEYKYTQKYTRICVDIKKLRSRIKGLLVVLGGLLLFRNWEMCVQWQRRMIKNDRQKR